MTLLSSRSPSSRKPVAFVITTACWIPVARLGTALAQAGFTVDAACPGNHPIRKSHAVRHTYTYSGLSSLGRLKQAITAARPDILAPADDLATQNLYRLYKSEMAAPKKDVLLCALIERSLGSPESIPLIYSRARFIEAAKEEGIRVPKVQNLPGVNDLGSVGGRVGFPAVLKSDGSFAGSGVRIVHDGAEARQAFRELKAPPLLMRAIKRALFDQDTTLIWPSLLRRRAPVSAHQFIPGREATSTVVCWQGQVLASHHFEVLKTAYPRGPATVVRLIEDAGMSSAAEKMVRRLKLSGLHGLDFVRDSGGRHAYLIEMNPRATQAGHLALGPGRDLCAALYTAITGEAVQARPKITDRDTIVLYPQELVKNPASPFLGSGYHDVPWDDPDLALASIERYRGRNGRHLGVESVQAALKASPRQP